MDYLDYTYLAHHGVKGQKWGVRRYQNIDGTLTEAGKSRRAKLENKIEKQNSKISSAYKKMPAHYLTDIGKSRQEKAMRKVAVSNKKIDKYNSKIQKMTAMDKRYFQEYGNKGFHSYRMTPRGEKRYAKEYNRAQKSINTKNNPVLDAAKKKYSELDALENVLKTSREIAYNKAAKAYQKRNPKADSYEIDAESNKDATVASHNVAIKSIQDKEAQLGKAFIETQLALNGKKSIDMPAKYPNGYTAYEQAGKDFLSRTVRDEKHKK